MSSDMTALEPAAMRPLARKMLAQRAGSHAGAKALAAAARGAYDDLVRVSVPLIGQVGVHALADRASHLARREHSCLLETKPDLADEPFARMIACLERQEPSVAAEAAATVFALLAGLLVAFIGEPLTMQLLRQAWPDVLFDASTRSQNK